MPVHQIVPIHRGADSHRSRPAHGSPVGASRGPLPAPRPAATTVHQLLAAARRDLDRVTPSEAAVEQASGALLVDIRPEAARRTEGEIPGSVVIERNVLEWRLDPASADRLPEAVSHDLRVIVVCSEGYTSSLAAASLRQLGLHRATDMDGGFRRWLVEGHPIVPGGTPAAPPSAAIMQVLLIDDQQNLHDHGGGGVVGTPAAPPLRVDEERWTVHVHGRPVPLTRQELRLLIRLRRADGRVLSRRALLDTIEGLPRVAYRTVDVHIHRLRRKLGPDVGACLVTVRGVGYAFDPNRRADPASPGTPTRSG